jgi:subtilase family serine protease
MRKLLTASLAVLVSSLGAKAAPGAIDEGRRTTLVGSRPPQARADHDLGRMPDDAVVHGASLLFARTDRQRADLAQLIEAQHDPASPLYHRWLTPEQFADRFGPAASDIAAATSWLEAHGLAVEGLSRSRDRLRFSGTASRIGAAFGTELHHYRNDSSVAFAPASDLTIPAALGGAVRAVGNLHSFRLQPRLKPAPAFTSSQSGNNFLTPGDIATIYDLTPLYAAGLDGSGQAIAVMGQSAIMIQDVERFQRAAGVRVHDPVQILVPGTGTAARVTGDWAEGDLDVEYTTSIAPGAVVYYVFTGTGPGNFSAFDSIQYAVDNDVAPIISSSYGICETALSATDYATLEGIMSQGAAQGQSIINASGDSGSTDCSGVSGLTLTQQQALAVDYPASSAFVTGIGGTEITPTAAAKGSPFWTPEGTTDIISSAISYMPEQVWNDDVAGTSPAVGAGGGGTSAVTPRPSWQTSFPGMPSGNKRLVPDISLASSPNNAGYLFCSNDFTQTGVNGSCSNGFRDIDTINLTVAGGTSFATPVFAGMVALLEQKLAAGGQGIVAKTLYGLAANPATYSSAFHDITAGGNQCIAGPTLCSPESTTSYVAGTGYDEASGLGSVDFANLMAAWPAETATFALSQVAISAANPSPLAGANDQVTVTVASASAGTTVTPTGSVLITVNGAPVSATLTLSGGVATYVFSSTFPGAQTVTATYGGDAHYGSSQATVPITVQSSSFALTATDAAVALGGSATSTVTVTPQNGYTGTIGWQVTTAPGLSQGCFSIGNTTVNGTAPVQAQLTIDADAAVCGVAARATSGRGQLASRWPGRPLAGSLLLGLAFAGLVGSGAVRRKRWLGLLAVAAVAAGLAACGNSGSSPAARSVKGTYVVTITGTDTNSVAITASTTMTLTIQ